MSLSFTSAPSPWSRASRWWPHALGVAVVAMAGSWLAWRLEQGEGFRVHEVRIAGNERVSAAAVRHLSDVRDGQHLWSVDLTRTVRNLESHPWIESAQARRVFPGVVEIAVRERDPVLLLSLDRLWYVDAEGVPFREAEATDLDYPVVTGLDPWVAVRRPDLGRAVLQGALRAVHAADVAGHVLPQQLSEIHFDASLGYELVLRTGARLVLGFGDPTGPLMRWAALASELDLHEPRRVDLASPEVAILSPLPAFSTP